MSGMGMNTSSTPYAQFSTPAKKCPFAPGSFVVPHIGSYAIHATSLAFAMPMSHPAGITQTESKWRIARDRSRQKRGPPAASLL